MKNFVKLRNKEMKEMLHEQYKFFNESSNDIIVECHDLIATRREETQKNIGNKILLTFIDIALERGQSIDKIVEQVDKIETIGFSMKGKGQKLKTSMNCQNLCLYFMIFFITIVRICFY
jgi:hypothetical protein